MSNVQRSRRRKAAAVTRGTSPGPSIVYSPPLRRRRLMNLEVASGNTYGEIRNSRLAARLGTIVHGIIVYKKSILHRRSKTENVVDTQQKVVIGRACRRELVLADLFGKCMHLVEVIPSTSQQWPKRPQQPQEQEFAPTDKSDGVSALSLEIKIEDNAPSPSTSSAFAPPISLPASVTALSTPRSASVAGAESNIERVAKQEAQVLSRVAELRRQGLWSVSRLPMIEMPPRNKTHHDYFLEEMRWMALDFRQERIFKRQAAKKFSSQVARIVREKKLDEVRLKQKTVRDTKRVCSLVARMVHDFWQNVDRVVDYRAQEILDSIKRRALDQQLNLMVGRADKLSEIVQEGLGVDRWSQTSCSVTEGDVEDEAGGVVDSDDDLSIEVEDEYDPNVDELIADGNLELEDLLDSLPPDYLKTFARDSDATLYSETVDMKQKETPREAYCGCLAEESFSQSVSSVSENTVDTTDSAMKDVLSANINYERLTSVNSEERQKELANIAEEALKFQPKGFTLETTQVKTTVPFLIRGTLREYQLVGLDWLVTLYQNGLNGILADEMGLGKTIQTIALLAHLACKEFNWGPHLIIVPTSVILNWEMEFKKWCPAFKILTYFGHQKERIEKRKGWSKPNVFHVCITSYKIITQDIRSFKQRAWQYLVLDEAQNIKNFKSQRWQTLLNIRARRRLLLTGTPLQNSLMELWSLMHFLMPAIFASHNDFKDWFSNPLTDMMEGNTEWNAPLIQRLHKVLRPFILRRLKSDVEKQLPEKVEHIISCPLSKRQRCLYDDFLSRRTTRENLRSGSVMSVLNIVMQLRKCCNHPNLFEPRPILSPFVMRPLFRPIPAVFFNISSGILEDPELTDFVLHQSGSHFACIELQRLCTDGFPLDWVGRNAVSMPKVPKFRFSRPPPQIHVGQEGKEGTKILVPVPVPPAGVPCDSDLYLCVENGIARVYQLVVGSSGERTIRECDPGAVTGVHSLSTNVTTSVTLADNVAKGCTNDETQTRCSSEPVLTERPEVYARVVPYSVTSNGRTGIIREATAISLPTEQPEQRHSPAWATRTRSAGSDAVGNASRDSSAASCSHVIRMEAERAAENLRRKRTRKMLETYALRMGAPKMKSVPLVSEELLVAVRKELKKKKRMTIAFGSDGIVRFIEKLSPSSPEEMQFAVSRLNVWTSDAIQRFTVYVHRVLADQPLVVTQSSGLPAYCRQRHCEIEKLCLRAGSFIDPLLSRVEIKHKIHFPELRLIEYDCGKLRVLSDLLRELCLFKHRCLIFTQMARVLDILESFLSFHGYQYFRLDGSTGIEQRQALTERFNADTKIFCFILSTRSGGIGVNLTGADTVIFYDSDWNPTMDAQAQDRCHRIGQTRNVTIYRLISERTIEENILKKAMQKRRLGEMAIDEGGFTPEFFKGDNVRDLFEGEAVVADLIVPLAVNDNNEIEKAMADVEDIQDVHAAQRVNAEAAAEVAEFDENVTPSSSEIIYERADSKYYELLNQLKPIERYAISFLEAERKPGLEESVKETKAMLASKKDEWLRAQVAREAEDDELLVKELANVSEEIDDFTLACQSGFANIEADEEIHSVNEMFCLSLADEYLPAWFPPSPPRSVSDDDDVYIDHTGDYLYELELMDESRLPKQIHELHRPRPLAPTSVTFATLPLPTDSAAQDTPVFVSDVPPIITSPPTPTGMCTVASGIVRDVLSSPAAGSPAASNQNVNLVQSADSTSAAGLDASKLLLSPSTVAKSEDCNESGRKSAQKSVHGARSQLSNRTTFVDTRSSKDLKRPLSPPPKDNEASDYDGPDWNVAEDHSLLHTITKLQHLPGHLHSSKNAQNVGWDFISQYLAMYTCVYRSPRQSSLHYQMVVQPREEGRMITLDPVTKKTRKVPLTTAEMMHMKRGRTKTDQQFYADTHKLFNQQYIQKMKAEKNAVNKQLTPYKRVVGESTLSATSGRPSPSQEAKLMEYRYTYDDVLPALETTKARYKRLLEMKEQEKEILARKNDELKAKNSREIEGRREREKKLLKRERAVVTLLGMISYQLPSSVSIYELATATTTTVGASPAGIRSYAPTGCVQGPVAASASVPGSSCAGEAGQVLVGQRAYLEHPQGIISSPSQGPHQISTRRVAIPVATGTGTQHQIVMTTGAPVATGNGQQPYAVVVTSQDNLSGGGRFQYATRQDAIIERPVYRTISTSPTKRPMPSVQRSGYATVTEGQQQLYGGRTLIMPQGEASSGDSSHMQMVRPQSQATPGTPLRQQKLGQRTTPSRVFLTTSTAGERTFIMPQQQVRMLAGNQRLATKRPATNVHPKAVPGQSQVTMMVPARGGNIQQIRTIRNISYPGVRVPPVGFIMSGSNTRAAENASGSGAPRQLFSGVSTRQTIATIPPAGTPRQVTIAVQGTNSHLEGSPGMTVMRESAPGTLQDHPGVMSQQHPQYLPPITLSSQPTVQQRYVATSVAPSSITALQAGDTGQPINPQAQNEMR